MEIRLLENLPDYPEFHGVLGTGPMQNRRLAMDLEDDGLTLVGRLNPLRPRRRIRGMERGDPLRGARIPCLALDMRDARGRWVRRHVGADTGFNAEMSLPRSMIRELGLEPDGRKTVFRPQGADEVVMGTMTVAWMGQERRVEWVEQSDINPPTLGIGMMWGRRLTVDFDNPTPAARISAIPRPAGIGAK